MDDDELIRIIKTRVRSPRLRSDLRTNPPPLFPPVEPNQIARAEASLGLTLPPFLSRLYREVANGGFGPGGGLVGLQGGHGDSAGLTLVEVYNLFRKADEGWPVPHLPLWEGDPPIWFGVDVRSVEERVVLDDEYGARPTAFTLRAWFEAWLRGVNLFGRMRDFELASAANPFTEGPGELRSQGRPMGTQPDFVGREPK
jgi:hypothetical protein